MRPLLATDVAAGVLLLLTGRKPDLGELHGTAGPGYYHVAAERPHARLNAKASAQEAGKAEGGRQPEKPLSLSTQQAAVAGKGHAGQLTDAQNAGEGQVRPPIAVLGGRRGEETVGGRPADRPTLTRQAGIDLWQL